MKGGHHEGGICIYGEDAGIIIPLYPPCEPACSGAACCAEGECYDGMTCQSDVSPAGSAMETQSCGRFNNCTQTRNRAMIPGCPKTWGTWNAWGECTGTPGCVWHELYAHSHGIYVSLNDPSTPKIASLGAPCTSGQTATQLEDCANVGVNMQFEGIIISYKWDCVYATYQCRCDCG